MAMWFKYDRVNRLGFLGVLLWSLAACSNTSSPDAAQACVAAGGHVDAVHQECLDVSPTACEGMGGQFQECASPCRHQPEAMMCITRCDAVCVLPE